jgi:phosphate transport system substrate-binding protein
MASSVRRGARAARVLGVSVVIAGAVQLMGVAPAGASPTMQSTGSSFASVAIQQWVGQSSILYGLNINWQVSSSVIGLNNFGQNQIDFAASDIPYSAEQSTYYPTQPYQYLPDVAGGLAFMFNLIGNDGQRITNLNLDSTLIDQIFLGEITNWDNKGIASLNPQLTGDLPNQRIIPVYRSDASGENYLLSDYLLHEDGGDFTAAQNAFLSGNPGQPSASWPVPTSNSNPSSTTYPGWAAGNPEPQNGSDNAANYVSALASVGAITYVETAYAKEHNMPVANLANASGAYVQPTSLNVATALEAALLHPDLTQDLTNVYTNPLPNAYPLSAYSYLVAPCTPSLASGEGTACAANPTGVPGSNPTGPTSPFASQKGQALGQFVSFLACNGQEKMAELGYSPLPPVLVQEDFNAIGRMNGGVQPPPVSAADCKNPYVDGEIPLPGSPIVQGITGYTGGVTTTTGATGGGTGSGGGSGSGTGSSSHSGSGSGSSTGSVSGSYGSGSGSIAAAEAAAGLTPQLAAEGYTVVNGQIVRKLGVGGPNSFQRADTLVSATDAVGNPQVGMYLGWALLVIGLILLPPLIAMRVTRRRRALAPVDLNGPGGAAD